MSRSAPKKGRMSQVPLFINKLYQMIENKSNLQTISWTSTSDSFNIKSISKFTEEVLPSYFKHRNFASFIRQLNMYGFRKIRHSDGQNVYTNDNFKLGAKHLLKNITRKVKEDREDQIELYKGSGSDRVESISVNRQIQQLKTNQKNLEEMCRHFMGQNQRLLEQNQRIIHRMEEQQKQKQYKLQELLVYLLTQKGSKVLLNSSNATDPVLSIANEQYDSRSIKSNHMKGQPNTEPSFNPNPGPNQSPLETIGKAMQSNEQLRKFRSLFQGLFNKKDRKRDSNFTVVPPPTPEVHQPQPHFNLLDASDDYEDIHINPPESHQHEIKGWHGEDDKSFLSINDFLNADDYPEPNFEFQE